MQSPLYPFALKIKGPQIEIFAKKFGSSLYIYYKINMDTFIEYISTDTDGNYKFSYTLENVEGEFTLPPDSDGVEIINKLVEGRIIKTESITKLQELNII